MKTLIFIFMLMQGALNLAAQESTDSSQVQVADMITNKMSTNGLVSEDIADTVVNKGTAGQSKQSLLLLRESDMLMRLSVLPIYTWNDSTRHISPLPQDFYRIFETGSDENTISLNDAVGISLAGVKALSMNMKHYDLTLYDLQKTNEELSHKSRSLERVVDKQRKEIEFLKRQMQEVINRLPR